MNDQEYDEVEPEGLRVMRVRDEHKERLLEIAAKEIQAVLDKYGLELEVEPARIRLQERKP